MSIKLSGDCRLLLSRLQRRDRLLEAGGGGRSARSRLLPWSRPMYCAVSCSTWQPFYRVKICLQPSLNVCFNLRCSVQHHSRSVKDRD